MNPRSVINEPAQDEGKLPMKQAIQAVTLGAMILATCQAYADCPEVSAEAKPAPYPTNVVADYVLGCMLSNGVSPDMLRKCSCSLDYIAASIPYEEYEQVETLLRLQQIPGGGRAAVYKSSNWAKNAVAKLREVQAESTLRCF